MNTTIIINIKVHNIVINNSTIINNSSNIYTISSIVGNRFTS